MPLFTHGGVSLHVETLGAGPPVVLLHGLFVGNMATWYFTAAPILARTHRVVLFDLRGHGRSSRPASGYDVETMASDLAHVVAEHTSGPVALVGHSFGGVVALHFALRHPERVTRLALVEAPLPPASLGELTDFLQQDPTALLAALPPGARATWRLRERLTALVTETTLLSDLAASQDVSDAALSALRPPLLAVYGLASRCRPVGQRLARLVPNVRHVELSGGHYLPVEAPAALTQALVEFLDG